LGSRTLVLDDEVDLSVLLQVLGRLEALGAFRVVLSLVHLVDSVEDDCGSSESNASATDGDAHVSLHSIASRYTTIGWIFANADVRDAASFEGL